MGMKSAVLNRNFITREHGGNKQWDHCASVKVKEVEELCKGSLESVYSLYPTLSRLQAIGELESVGELFSRSAVDKQPSAVHVKWQGHSQLLKDSDFSFQEPVMALRTVMLELLMEKEMENSQKECFRDILTKHLVELSILARTFRNTQHDPKLKLIYTECLGVCGNWLAETCLENPAVIMQTYLEKDQIKAAKKIICTIRNRRPQMVRSVETLCEAYILLANFGATQWNTQGKGIKIPVEQPITKLKNIDEVVVPTVEIKGKILPTPETVPFRLTRDIVDGMGITGVEGVFRSEMDQSFNKVAERVLMRLQEKLKGVEEGTVLSVGGQVNLLLQQARDPQNLSRLFPGWKAWV